MLARGTPSFIALPPLAAAALAVLVALGTVPQAWWSIAVVVVLALLSVLGLAFFRDPERRLGEGLVAPAHGRVIGVDDEDGGMVRVSTFMGPMDVHVVRAPLDGRVVDARRGGSGFRRAYTPAADGNVRLDLYMEDDGGPYQVALVSGWFARRIVPYVEVGDSVSRGERIGLIRFGSRVDVVVPRSRFDPRVGKGDRVVAGETSLGVVT